MQRFFFVYLFCLLILVEIVSAQDRSSNVPTGSPIPCDQRSFSIPFEVRGEGAADPPKEIELLYSADRGVRWFSAERVPVEAKKFDFTAKEDGEYWFVFRTITLSGQIKATNQATPQLRVLVDTARRPLLSATSLPGNPMTETISATAKPEGIPFPVAEQNVPQVRGSGAVPLTPPKPLRMHTRSEAAKKPATTEDNPSPKVPTGPPALFSPSGEMVTVLPQTEPPKEKPRTADPLLADMNRFFGGKLTESEKNTKTDDWDTDVVARLPRLDSQIPSPVPATAHPAVAADQSAPERPSGPGSISGVSLGDVSKQPRVVVRWNHGDDSWRASYVDVLRGASTQGPWYPIATNLPNSGEYWWFVTNEDLKPFYVSVRLRSSSGASTTDATAKPIRIDPAMFNGK